MVSPFDNLQQSASAKLPYEPIAFTAALASHLAAFLGIPYAIYLLMNFFLVIGHLLRVVAVVRPDGEDAVPRVLDALPFVCEALLDHLDEVAGTV